MGNRTVVAVFAAAIVAIAGLPGGAEARATKLSIRDATASEGGSLAFVVSLSKRSHRPVYVDYTTVEGTADDSQDFVARSGTMRFAPGRTKRVLNVSVTTDRSDEPSESMTVALSAPRRASIHRAVATGTITDIDEPPSLSIADTIAREGAVAAFTVALSAVSGLLVSAELSTLDDTAIAGQDYDPATSTVVFPPGQRERTVSVSVIDDTDVEEDETFDVELSSPVNATVKDERATGTITDDDVPTPVATIADTGVVEGDAGETPTLSFSVTLDMPAPREVQIAYATAPATGTSIEDYSPANGTVVFLPGQRERTVDVLVRGDDLDEADTEAIMVRLDTPRNVQLGDDEATGTIHDDDDPPTVSVNDIVDREPRRGSQPFTFTVRLSAPSGRAIMVAYATRDGSARAPADYVRMTGSLTFAAGETSKVLYVYVRGDTIVEDREIFWLDLSSPEHATVAKGSGAGKIKDADG